MLIIKITVAIVYVVLTHVIAQYIGTKRKIGYGKSVFWSILFSPVIGLVITLLSEKKPSESA
jgi:hypothetical protein